MQLPEFVLNYLLENNHFGNTRTLIIGENYPGTNYINSYFYRSLPSCLQGAQLKGRNLFFENLCDGLLVPKFNYEGRLLTEFERLNKFLQCGYLIIDSLQNQIKATRPAILSPQQSDELVKSILIINPKNIIFLTENNSNVIDIISHHSLFNLVNSKIAFNHLKQRTWFSFPSAPANPNLFKEEIEAARLYYYF